MSEPCSGLHLFQSPYKARSFCFHWKGLCFGPSWRLHVINVLPLLHRITNVVQAPLDILYVHINCVVTGLNSFGIPLWMISLGSWRVFIPRDPPLYWAEGEEIRLSSSISHFSVIREKHCQINYGKAVIVGWCRSLYNKLLTGYDP